MDTNKVYYLNICTGVLHLRGSNCKDAKYVPVKTEAYNYEEEVFQAHGLTFKWCKKCLSWREDIVRQTVLQKEARK